MTGGDPRAEDLFAEALERAAPERRAFVEEAAGGDESLRDEVLALLGAHASAGDFLETDAITAAAAARDPLPGTRVGPWRLGDCIGAGGMGRVYAGHRDDGAFEQRVAIKVVRHGFDTDELLARFRRERAVLARLEHPNVARLLDAGVTEDGRPCIVMEFVDGAPIEPWCDERRCAVPARLRLFAQACDAVAAAHRRLIVHRDVKPANLLVTAEGTVKLVDFGIARLLDGPADGGPADPSVTSAGGRVLTPAYASPEQLRGEPPTTATDVFSLGVVLHRLLTGEHPWPIEEWRSEARRTRRASAAFEAGGRDAAARAAARSATPAQLARRLRGDLDRIVAKALAADPAERYGGAADLGADVMRSLRNEPILATPPSTVDRARKFVRRHRAAVAVTAGAAALLLVALVVTATALAQARAEASFATSLTDYFGRLLAQVDPWSDEPVTSIPRETKLVDVAIRASESVGEEFAAKPELEAAIRQTLGRTFTALGMLEEAEAELVQSHALMSAARGERDARSLDAQHHLGVLHYERDELTEAEAVYRKVLAARTHVLGADHDDTIDTLNNLALTVWAQGRFLEAEPLAREVLARRLESGAPDRAEALIARSNLGLILRALGKLDEAEPLFREEVRLATARYGPGHPWTVTARNNLGTLLYDAERFEEAEALFREILALREESLGFHHDATLVALANLAAVVEARERYDEAAELYDRAIARNREAGHAPAQAAVAMVNLASCRRKQGHLEMALECYEECVALFGSEDSPDAFGLGVALAGRATTLAAMGRKADARAGYEAARATFVGAVGADHDRVKAIDVALADLDRDGGE
jgi:serine/threonine-protein kinase